MMTVLGTFLYVGIIYLDYWDQWASIEFVYLMVFIAAYALSAISLFLLENRHRWIKTLLWSQSIVFHGGIAYLVIDWLFSGNLKAIIFMAPEMALAFLCSVGLLRAWFPVRPETIYR